jgi:hypothetical protein
MDFKKFDFPAPPFPVLHHFFLKVIRCQSEHNFMLYSEKNTCDGKSKWLHQKYFWQKFTASEIVLLSAGDIGPPTVDSEFPDL